MGGRIRRRADEYCCDACSGMPLRNRLISVFGTEMESALMKCT
jgi:hypothetical protein